MVDRFVIALGLVLAGASIAAGQGTRDVTVSTRSIVEVHTKVRYTTLIILPEHERILDYVCGDKDLWVVSGADNLAYVKPAKVGVETNLNLVTASGTVYSFLLTEGAAPLDLKVYVVPDASLALTVGARKFYTADEVETLRRAAEDAKKVAEEAEATATQRAEARIDAFRASYPTSLQFPYRVEAQKAPFRITAMYTDGTFTFIRAAGTELPALYELRDGVPSLVHFQVEHGVYVVPKVLDRGYLVIGKRRVMFERTR
jgi:type IV secretion system protein VirB9